LEGWEVERDTHVVVAAGEISEDGIEVAGLLHAIPDARELIAEVLTAGVGGVKLRARKRDMRASVSSDGDTEGK
jgi:hypothetical protein